MKNSLTYLNSTFTDGALRAMQADLDTSLSLRTLDVDQAQITLESAADLSSFAQNSPLRFLRGGSQYELWFLQQVTRIGPKTWTLLTFSSLGRLTQMPHRGGIYTGQIAAGDLIREICGYENGQPAAGVTVYVDAAFEEALLYGWLPYVSPSGEDSAETGSARDNLLQVLFALNAAVRDDANGVLRVENLGTSVSSVLGADKLYRGGAKVVYDPTVTAVTVLEHQYSAGAVGTETKLFEGTATAGQVIVFSEPMGNLVATGFTITESGANYAVLSAGSGTLTGRPYVHTTREITRTIASAPVENTVRIEGATLVSVTNSAEVANRLADYYAHRTRIEADAIIEYEDAGDVVSIYDPFDKVMRQACIEKISPLTVSQTMKGRISALLGFTPWQVVEFEDVREVLTGGGTWTVPEGVTEVTAVLIGGGQGGSAGNQGGAPQRVPSIATNNYGMYHNKQTSITADDAGAGGLPGVPGAGGNILRIDLSVSAGDIFAFDCGLGGGGALPDSGAAGAPGTDTTFGPYTSASGAPNDSGYVDVTTGNTYGQRGEAGLSGGKGASYIDPDPEPLIADGVTFGHGSQGASASGSAGQYNQGYGAFGYLSLGSYGGGPAYGANGKNGANGAGWATPSGASAVSQIGGMGADALPPVDQTNYGQGGTGGNGGGGRGGYGSALAYNNYESPATGGASSSYAISIAALSAGGQGSAGGKAGDGVILLYYRRPMVNA